MPLTVACFEGEMEEMKRASDGRKEKRIFRHVGNSAFWDGHILGGRAIAQKESNNN